LSRLTRASVTVALSGDGGDESFAGYWRVPGKAKTAEEYIRESIVEPNEYVVSGFPAGVMVQDFGKKLSGQDIDDLIAFLMAR